MKVELTKEMFCNLIDSIERHWRLIEQIEGTFDIEITESKFLSLMNTLVDVLIELLTNKKEHYSDSYYIDDISYYMWELDFGKKWKPGCLTIDDKDIPLRNSEDLWNILMLGENDET